MAYFNRGGGFNNNRDSNRSFGGGSARGNSSGYDRSEMFQAVCAQCGKECQVPFKPNGSRPIYCSSCFEAQGGGSDRGSRDNSRSFGNSRPTFDARPRFNEGERNVTARPQNDLDLRAINIKLDRIIDLLTQKALPTDVIAEVEKKVAKTKAIKKLIKKSLSEDAAE